MSFSAAGWCNGANGIKFFSLVMTDGVSFVGCVNSRSPCTRRWPMATISSEPMEQSHSVTSAGLFSIVVWPLRASVRLSNAASLVLCDPALHVSMMLIVLSFRLAEIFRLVPGHLRHQQRQPAPAGQSGVDKPQPEK